MPTTELPEQWVARLDLTYEAPQYEHQGKHLYIVGDHDDVIDTLRTMNSHIIELIAAIEESNEPIEDVWEEFIEGVVRDDWPHDIDRQRYCLDKHHDGVS